MINWLKKVFGKPQESQQAPCVWVEIGNENPFNARILDVRPVTQTMLSFTRNKDLAQSFVDLRHSDGADLREAVIEDSTAIACNLEISVPEAPDDGPLFKAAAMEDKWDIYAYSSVFYLARSWDGSLIYKAPFRVECGLVGINEITCSMQHADAAVQDVFYLLVSHVLKRPLPSPIPQTMDNDPEKIAAYCFNKYGRMSLCASYSNVVDILVVESNTTNGR